MSTTSPDLGRPRPNLNTDTLALGAVFIAIFSFVAAIFAVGLAARAIDEHRAVPAAAAAASSASVTLADFSIDPEPLALTTGTVVRVTNAGAIVHNLSVEGNASPMVGAGEETELDLSGLTPGTYKMRCDVPGHAEAGMRGTVIVG